MKTQVITWRVSKAQKDIVEEKASSMHMKVSQYLWFLITKEEKNDRKSKS